MGFHRGVGDIDNDMHAAAGVPSAGTGGPSRPVPWIIHLSRDQLSASLWLWWPRFSD